MGFIWKFGPFYINPFARFVYKREGKPYSNFAHHFPAGSLFPCPIFKFAPVDNIICIQAWLSRAVYSPFTFSQKLLWKEMITPLLSRSVLPCTSVILATSSFFQMPLPSPSFSGFLVFQQKRQYGWLVASCWPFGKGDDGLRWFHSRFLFLIEKKAFLGIGIGALSVLYSSHAISYYPRFAGGGDYIYVKGLYRTLGHPFPRCWRPSSWTREITPLHILIFGIEIFMGLLSQ